MSPYCLVNDYLGRSFHPGGGEGEGPERDPWAVGEATTLSARPRAATAGPLSVIRASAGLTQSQCQPPSGPGPAPLRPCEACTEPVWPGQPTLPGSSGRAWAVGRWRLRGRGAATPTPTLCQTGRAPLVGLCWTRRRGTRSPPTPSNAQAACTPPRGVALQTWPLSGPSGDRSRDRNPLWATFCSSSDAA